MARATLGFELPEHNPGGKSSWPLMPGVKGSAEYRGDNNEHRITLERVWGDPSRFALWIGMNPSMARHDVDDLTVRKEQTWTRIMHIDESLTKLGLVSAPLYRYVKMNVGTYRLTDSRKLDTIDVPLCHGTNLTRMREMMEWAEVVVLTTGEVPDTLYDPYHAMTDLLHVSLRKKVVCLGKTASGWPKHSSRLSYSTPYKRYFE